MSFSLLITGGARSGKSSFAEKRSLSYGTNVIYIATAQAFDEEMENRIRLHQQRRGDEWRTISEPFAIANIMVESILELLFWRVDFLDSSPQHLQS